jgi:hypothetical protein
VNLLLRAASAAGFVFVIVCAASADGPADYGAAACATASDGACPNVDWDCGCGPKWTVDAGAIFLDRSTPENRQIARSLGGTTTISAGGEFNFNWGAGPDISIARRFDCGDSIEVRYFSADNTAPTVDYPAGNFQLGSFSNFGATDLRGQDRTELENIEINWLHPVNDRFTFIAGFRSIELHDQLSYLVTFPGFNAAYSWDEQNHLYGGQVGGKFSFFDGNSPWLFDVTGKAGAYGTASENAFDLRPNTGGSFPGGANAVDSSFVGELDFKLGYRLTEHISVYGGYQLLWIDTVALASDQAANATRDFAQNVISPNQDIFYHGAQCGVEFGW